MKKVIQPSQQRPPSPHGKKENEKEFSKYKSKGAYHWRMISRNLLTHHCFTAARYETALRLAGNIMDKRVLDFGCGDGAFLYLIRQHTCKVTGYDPNIESIQLANYELAKRGLKIPLVSKPGDLAREEFDVVFLLEVIEHVYDIKSLLAEVHRILKPRGKLVVTTPIRLTENPIDSEHVREFFPSELKHELSLFFHVEQLMELIPVAAAELYYWRPRIFLGLPLAKLIMNFMSIYWGMNPIYGIGTIDRYHMQLAARCRK